MAYQFILVQWGKIPIKQIILFLLIMVVVIVFLLALLLPSYIA